MARVSITTDIPARLDRLPWSRFHLLVVVALGVTWILDGLEVTIVGSIGPVLQNSQTLGLSAQEIGSAGSAYVVGAVIGALLFGWLTDRFGRRLVFYLTLIVYLAGVLLSATSWDFWSFALFRAITGFGIGGEYAAINSAIDELIPANFRGRVDLIVNGSFWLGAAAGSGASLLFLDPNILPINVGWRLGFAVGGVLGLGILLLRRYVPESPRWLVTHGYSRRAEETVAEIEERVRSDTGSELRKPEGQLKVHPRKNFGFALIFWSMLGKYRASKPARPDIDDRAVLFVQCCIFFLRLGAHEVLRSSREPSGALPVAAYPQQFHGSFAAGASVRHRRSPNHDHGNVCGWGHSSDRDRNSVRRKRTNRVDADHRVDGSVLFLVGGSKLRLSDRE